MRTIIFTKTACMALLSSVLFLSTQHGYAQNKKVTIEWDKTLVVSKTTATLQVVNNPMLNRNSSMHEGSFSALKDMKADYVRFVPWFPYAKSAVVELKEPTATETFWDFSNADHVVEDFMKATEGHPVVMNFSTIPVWMFRLSKPVVIPNDPNQVFWDYNQGFELRDPSMKELAGYFSRLFSWYTKGGFTDELGKFHKSNYHYKFPYWEVLNEPDLEHNISPQMYTKMYDAIVTELKKISPETKFVGITIAYASSGDWFEYFLNPKNHKPGVPLEGISYHFYATPAADEPFESWQYTFFNLANGFLDRTRYIESIRKRLSPKVFTHINELGCIIDGVDYQGVIPPEYWNLAGSMYAYLYVQLTKMGIELAGESQLVGYPTQFPDVSMMNWKNSKPNARYWVLKLLKDNFGPGDVLKNTSVNSQDVVAQAFETSKGKKLLLINKRNKTIQLDLPENFKKGKLSYVDVSTGENHAGQTTLSTNAITIKPFSVTVIDL